MGLMIEFNCVLPNGVHARPASRIEQICNGFASEISWRNLRTGTVGNAKSVLSLIGTDTLHEDRCQLMVEGADEDAAHRELARFIEQEFPHCDEALPATATPEEGFSPLPRSLGNLSPKGARARSVSEGIGIGRLFSVDSFDFSALEPIPSEGFAVESERMQKSLALLVATLRAQLQDAAGTEAELLNAHVSIASDVEYASHLRIGLSDGLSCAQAIAATAGHYRRTLQNSASALMRERELDIRDISFQLLRQVYGPGRFDNTVRLDSNAVCIAEHLTPSQFIELDKTYLKGLLLEHGGSTSHTVILARSFGIPTLVGVNAQELNTHIGTEVIVDADAGMVLTDPSEAIARYYEQERSVKRAYAEQIAVFTGQRGTTRDGRAIEVAANIALPIEAASAFSRGAESIGLFRTEMMYMDRSAPPDENEQYNMYCEVIEAAAGKSIIARTMDIGGDKPIEYLNIPTEPNPFLGYRAVRIYAEFIDLFKTQLRAILRASAHGSLKIMVPMISSLEEILWVKEVLAEVKHALREEKILFDESIPLGIMLEVPSIAYIIDQCCEEIDFFSIGSNDLTQYLLAVDRENSKVVKHYNSLNPAFLRALDHVVQEVHRHGKWIGLCGELGAKGSVLPLLVGLGLDEISMSAAGIAATKARLAKLDSKACRQLLNRAMACRTPVEVETLLAQFGMKQEETPLVTPDCIALDTDLRSKDEVVKFMTDRLFLAGRCRYPARLADDVWAREDVFSTGLGFGFAIPHTKSEHIEQSTISVARLKSPIVWGEDEARFVILLTLNKHTAGDQHMKIFSRLARRIMNQEFRQALVQSDTPEAIEALLRVELAL